MCKKEIFNFWCACTSFETFVVIKYITVHPVINAVSHTIFYHINNEYVLKARDLFFLRVFVQKYLISTTSECVLCNHNFCYVYEMACCFIIT